MIIEKRKTRRRQLRHGAKLFIGPKQFHDCRLSNVSDAGARIEVADSGLLPDRFLLLLAARGTVRRACQVVWREPNQVGVRFVRAVAKPAKKSAKKPAKPSPPAAENVAAPERAEPELAQQD